MTLRFRVAGPHDAAALTRLAVRSKRAWGYGEDFMRRVMPDMLVHPRYLTEEHGVVAEEDGKTVGYAIVRVHGTAAVLRDLFVEPDRFRQGIGKALFDQAVRYARAHGAATLTLTGDPNARAFYERMGMRHVGAEPSIAGNGRTLPLMEMVLAPET